MSITLGPFELLGQLARGGMGVVYRASHKSEGAPAAVKVIARTLANPSAFYEDFRREVQAAAQLTHPNIVTLYDYGAVPDDAAAASEGKLLAGSPYLVMELVDGGSLNAHPPEDFETMRRQLLELLSALGHAHAHGIVHRDLKPQNVLVAREGSRIKLADFGIAHASDRREGGEDLEMITGTRSYMAPEQVECSWRDYGPWTDLYALGIIAWELTCGYLPFRAEESMAVMLMHLEREVPKLAPQFEVPAGLDAWIRRLCKINHRARFQRAADAALELEMLEAPEGAVSVAVPASLAEASEPTLVSIALPREEDLRAPQPIEPAPLAASVPTDWRAPAAGVRRLLGAGVGLYFLRTVELVDRERERDVLWTALRRCSAEGTPRAILLRGPTGTGKSRLAAWLAVRAHETGAAHVLKATHDASPGPAHGLTRMLELHHRALGLSGRDLVDHLEGRLKAEGITDPREWRTVASLIDESAGVRFETPLERYVAIEGVLGRSASSRTVVVWMDDVQWGGDALGLVEHALASLVGPVLFVLTVRDDARGDRPRESAQLEHIEAHERTSSCVVGPLSTDDTGLLVESLLGLSGPLASHLRTRVGGNPLFAVQLIGDWVQRGVLMLTKDGFTLRSGEAGEIPDDLHTVWIERVERVLSARPPGDREVLELAATLGSSIDTGELERVCELFGRAMQPDLLEAMLRASLCTRTDAGWAFVHGMLRESVLRTAQSAGRAAGYHRLCARMLEGQRGRGIAARRAYHLEEAGELAAALEPLIAAARELLGESDFPLARATLARREELLARLGVPDEDRAWGIGWVLRADCHRLEWDFDASRVWAENARSCAERYGWSDVEAHALGLLGHAARQQGDLPLAEHHQRRALAIFTHMGDDEGRVKMLLALAVAARQGGEMAAAEEMYARAYAYFEVLGDERGAANALLGLAHIARHRKEYENAEAKYQQARDRFERAGYRTGVADCVSGIGDLARYRGDLDTAGRSYREAIRLKTATGSKGAVIGRLNLALVLSGQRRFGEARRAIEAEIPGLERENKRAYLGWAHTIMLACVVAENDLGAFDAHLSRALELGASRVFIDEDMAEAAEQAGRALLARGEIDRARGALHLAIAQWTALSDEARAETARALLD